MTQLRPVVATKKPTTIEAWRYTDDDSAARIVDWVESNGGFAEKHPHEPFIILGDKVEPVKPGQWVIRDQFNDYWPLPDSVYHAVYLSPVR